MDDEEDANIVKEEGRGLRVYRLTVQPDRSDNWNLESVEREAECNSFRDASVGVNGYDSIGVGGQEHSLFRTRAWRGFLFYGTKFLSFLHDKNLVPLPIRDHFNPLFRFD